MCSCPVIDCLMYVVLCQLTYDVTRLFMLKYYKTNYIKLVMERKYINIDQSKVNNILKLFSKRTQIYDELLDESKQPLTVASKQYTVVIHILIKSPIFF